MKLHRVVAVAAIVGLGALAYWWQNKPVTGSDAGAPGAPAGASRPAAGGAAGPGGQGGPVAVEAGKVELMTLADDAQGVGTLRARQAVMLRPEVSGRVVKLGFADGQRVAAGQLLVQLEDSLQAAQLQQAEAQAAVARTQLQRNRELLGQGFVSASAVDQAEATLKVAEAQVALSKAQLQRMQVRAPFGGTTGIRVVSLGDYVKDGADLVAVEDSSAMWVDFRLPERYLSRLKMGQEVEVALDAMPGKGFKARIEALDTQLDANGRSILVRARMAGDTAALRSGQFARVRVVFALREQALVVPEEALVPMGGQQFVVKLVPGPEGKGLVSQRIEAKLGARVPGKVELLGGVKPGDLVATAGQARLMRGPAQPVKLVDLSARAAGAPASAPGRAASASAASSAASR
jgi:membrane fusion protein (multidrug efflux system)